MKVTATADVNRKDNLSDVATRPEMSSSHVVHENSSRQSSGYGGSVATLADAVCGSVKATTRAEQMTFRRENEMGLWESRSGWTIIFTVTVNN